MLAVLDVQCLSRICFIAPAVDEFNYNASRPFLAPLLRCWEKAAEPCSGMGGRRPRPRAWGKGWGAVASSDPWQASSSSFLAPQSKGEERGEGRSGWLVSKSCHFLWPSPEIRYHCSCQDDGLPPQQHPPPCSCLPLTPFCRLAFNDFEW